MSQAKHLTSGKVREIYSLNDSCLAIVTTDRISAYDVILKDLIPEKGKILNQISIFWMKELANIVPNHLVASAAQDIFALPTSIGKPDWLANRTMIVKKAKMYPVEFIVRGYLAGSAWREYQRTEKVKGVDLPSGLKLADKLPQPIFTPSTKAVSGHDQNLTVDEARTIIGDVVDEIARISIDLYRHAAVYAEEKNIIIADTKFEFGTVNGQITLADEVLTPDSSRFWYKDDWKPGENPPSLDKQIVRDWLDSRGWDHNPPPPKLSDKVIQETSYRYAEVCQILTNN